MSSSVLGTAQPTWGIFGGSFNPPHIGHVLAAHFALSVWGLDRVLVIPSFAHPFGKPLEPYADRVSMCELAFGHLDGHVHVSRIEEQLGGVSYTVETLRALRTQHPDVQLRLVIGSDIIAEAGKWRAFEEIKTLAPLLVIPRLQQGQKEGGADTHACYLPNVSSSQIRQNLAAGLASELALPAAVKQYISAHALYRNR